MEASPIRSGDTPPGSASGAEPVNVVLWAAFAGILLTAGIVSVFGVYGRLTADAALGVLTHVARTGLYVAIALLIEALLLRTARGCFTPPAGRRVMLHAFWILIMFLSLVIVADVVVFPFAGYHVLTGIRILFSDGLTGMGTVMEATGLSPLLAGLALLAFVGFLAAAAVLSRTTSTLSRHWNLAVTRRAATVMLLVFMGVLTSLEALSFHTRNPFLWEQEVRRVPLAFTLVKPNAALASFRVNLRSPRPMPVDQPALARAKEKAKPDIFILVLESLRKDVLTPEVMPRFSAFARRGWTFEHPVTTGNVTHYAWYGLFCGNHPIYFDVAKADARGRGSVPLAILREMGYRIDLLATPDMAYQNLETVVFDTQGRLLNRKFHPADKLPTVRDERVMDELCRTVRSEAAGGGVYLVALDSTHFDYAWSADFAPPFRPYATGASITDRYQKDPNARRLMENRYRNSAAWMDALLGRFFDALEAAGRMEESVIVITGDHGEAFQEHGPSTHGSDLGGEQLEVAFAMRLPGEAPRHFDTVFSLMDVMPTVLYHLGYEPAGTDASPGQPLQRQIASAGPSAPPAPERPRPGHAITFQGWNERAFRFALTYDDKRVLLELDKANPLNAHRLLVKRVSTLNNDTELLGEEGDISAYRQFLGDMPRIMHYLSFLEFE